MRIKKIINSVTMGVGLLHSVVSFATTPEGVLNKTIAYIQGPLGKSVGILVLMGIGFYCFKSLEGAKWKMIAAIVGLSLIFGAPYLYERWFT